MNVPRRKDFDPALHIYNQPSEPRNGGKGGRYLPSVHRDHGQTAHDPRKHIVNRLFETVFKLRSERRGF